VVPNCGMENVVHPIARSPSAYPGASPAELPKTITKTGAHSFVVIGTASLSRSLSDPPPLQLDNSGRSPFLTEDAERASESLVGMGACGLENG